MEIVIAADCPVRAGIDPTERLYVPHRKRLSHAYVVGDGGARELRIDYGIKEIVFDDERFFAFGERLVTEAAFTGHAATRWGDGYAWDELRPLLEALVDEGILRRGDGGDDPRGGGLVPSLVPPSQCPTPRFWSHAECEAITRELAGRAVEFGYLEAIVPVFRIAHPALDADGRQVGEANVFPPRLRLDRETEWRVCQYPGSRYRDEAPMNVTALRAMIKHWKPIMAATLEIRAALQQRLGLPRAPWTIGDLHLLSSVVLALPAFELGARGGSSPQLPLHPVLSSLFRITDGIRMAAEDMLFHGDPVRSAGEVITAAELHAHAEHHGVLLSRTGVCAGPRHLIDEFLVTAVDGVPLEGITGQELPAEIREILSRLPDAIDYGLRGMQVWGVSMSVWLAMGRAYEALFAILETAVPAGAADDDDRARLRARLLADRLALEQKQIARDADRDAHWKAYLDAYERSWCASRSPIGQPTLTQEIEPIPEGAVHAAVADRLRSLLRSRRGFAVADVVTEHIVATLVRYLREEQAILASTTRLQEAINSLLDRPRPARALCARDLRVSFVLGGRELAFPYLLDAFEEALGIRVESTASEIAVSDLRAS